METVLQTVGLTKRYGGFTALYNLNLALPQGRIIGLLGPNGSGKTTFLKICAGLLIGGYFLSTSLMHKKLNLP